MKVHLKEWADVKPWYQQEACDQLMVKQKHAASLTDNPVAVTCKHCLKAMANR